MALTALAFLLAFCGGLSLAIFWHPRFGLYTYLAVFYLHPPSRWWGIYLPEMRWSLIAALVTLIAALRIEPRHDVPPWSSTAPARLLLAFTAWMWIQNFWALAPDIHLEASILFTKYVVLYYLMYKLLTSVEEIGNVLFVHVLGCGYLGWLAYLAPGVGRLEGVGGPGIDDANGLGMFVGTGLICGAMLVLGERSWKRWICVLAMPFILNTVIQSESRGAMLGIVAGAFVIFYLRPQLYRKQFYAFAVLGVLLFGYLAPDVFWDRMQTLTAATDDTAELDSSAEGRVVLFKAQLEMAKSYPFGAGHRGTAVLSPLYLDEKWLTRASFEETAARSSHATMMSALVEQGIPGAIIFAALALWIGRMIRILRRRTKTSSRLDIREQLYGVSAAASLVVVFVSGLFTDYLKTEVQIWMFAILALTVLMHSSRKEAEQDSDEQATEADRAPDPVIASQLGGARLRVKVR